MRRILTLTLFLGVLLSACDMQDPQLSETVEENSTNLELRVEPTAAFGKRSKALKEDDRTAALRAYINQVNADPTTRAMGIAVEKAEWVGGGESHEAGQTVFAHDRQLRLPSQWVSGDPRRRADGGDITHVVDQTLGSANMFNPLPTIEAEPAIDASFDTWNEVPCSKLNVVKLPDVGHNYSAFFSIDGSPVVFDPTGVFYADISTIGFIPGSIFESIFGSGAISSVLGVTFTYIWLDEEGNPSDINNDGYSDTALKEVWYNDAHGWSTNGRLIDIETVALHENGHALGLGHFGKVFVTRNKLHVAPRAAMNAFILRTLRNPLGTDIVAYCGLSGAWPNSPALPMNSHRRSQRSRGLR